ncbi:hypothetical protein CC80DRAFT_549225 [Byssothecium circinans]|uniref:Uncharacterized protein n=1 Tax=Byssothecium circinans TaxID=147558 RepID=A0A6A5TXX7_9PLEO|nr:hypothetical protein CC80DRAFT_549225 [Byssothecium circinans]
MLPSRRALPGTSRGPVPRDQPPIALLQPLRVGSTGPAVTLMHAALLNLSNQSRDDPRLAAFAASSPVDEVASAVFGPTTRQAVLAVQAQYQKLLHAEPNGVWDRDLAAIVYTELLNAGISLGKPPQFFVAGRALFANNVPAIKVQVDVLDRDLSSSTVLGSASTDGQGLFFLHLPRSKVPRGSEREPALAIRINGAKDPIYETPLDQVVFNATSLTLFNVNLSQNSPDAPGSDEFSQAIASLDTILPPLQTGSGAAAAGTPSAPAIPFQKNIAQRIANLRDDPKVSNLRYLDLLGSLKVPTAALTKLVLSFRLSLLSSSNLKIDAPSELFYAILAADSQQSLAPNDPANIGLADLSLQTRLVNNQLNSI